ncbi:MAG: hypothetical protein AMXMBFR58_15140 [Phycisphaerae bacterium]
MVTPVAVSWARAGEAAMARTVPTETNFASFISNPSFRETCTIVSSAVRAAGAGRAVVRHSRRVRSMRMSGGVLVTVSMSAVVLVLMVV